MNIMLKYYVEYYVEIFSINTQKIFSSFPLTELMQLVLLNCLQSNYGLHKQHSFHISTYCIFHHGLYYSLRNLVHENYLLFVFNNATQYEH